jgi:hypothetical protein
LALDQSSPINRLCVSRDFVSYPWDDDGTDRMAPERSMTEPPLLTDNQPRLDPSHTIHENQLPWERRLARRNWPPFFRWKFNIKDNALVLANAVGLVQLQLGPIVDLPWIEPNR